MLLAVIGWALWTGASRPRTNVLLITLDTTRADHIGCYGRDGALTPVIDGLAKSGVQFQHAYAPIPLTLPSHASMFTGLYPPEHGVRTNGKNRLSDEPKVLAGSFAEKGYATAAFVASFVLDGKFGLTRGFQNYDDDWTGTAPADEALHRSRDGDIVTSRALKWLGENAEKPFFCWVHLYDPHTPYVPHQVEFGNQFAERPYDGEIAFVDLQIGRLQKFLRSKNLEANTLIVIVGDHGEGLNDHDERRHGQMIYNSTLHVPWIMSQPGQIPAGQKIDTPVSLVDLGPTLVDALKLQGDATVSGRSLMPLIHGETLPERGLYAETNEPLLESSWSPLRTLIGRQWKYIRSPKPELYDLTQDPRELNNLAESQPSLVEEQDNLLTDLEGGLKLREGAQVELSAAEQRRLAGLGYAGFTGTAADYAVNRDLPDIKDRIQYYNAVEDARQAIDAGEFDDAARRLTEVVTAVPDYEFAELSLGDIYLRQRKLAEALQVYQRVLARNPDSALARLHVGDVREAEGKHAEALAEYRQALEAEPDSAKLNYNIGRMLVLLGRDHEAEPMFKTAIELDPGYVFAHIELGSVLLRRGLNAAALEQYQTALQFDSRSFHAHMNVASALMQLNQAADAVRHLEQAVKLAPDNADARTRLGAVLLVTGQKAQARQQLQEALRLNPADPRPQELLKSLQ